MVTSRVHRFRDRLHRAGWSLGDTTEEVVYFIRAGDAIKIGRTGNMAARLRSLATASAVALELLATMPGGRQVEARLHRQWRHLHIRGEWFRADEELLRYIREQAAGSPAPEPDPRALEQAAQFRRVLAALGPADLAAAGLR
jgi:hypothetical protein